MTDSVSTIKRFRGDTTPITGTVKLNDLPLDVTGCAFVLTADPSRVPIDATNNLFALTGALVTPLTGAIKFPITAAQANQAPGIYYFDIQLVDGTGNKQTVVLDKLIFKQDISKG